MTGSLKYSGIAVALAAGQWALPAQAEHQANHRYTVRGYVRDAQAQPLGETGVNVQMGSERTGAGRTDTDGSYRIQLHDSGIGRRLDVRAAGHEGRVRVTATRGDTVTERVHDVDFLGGDPVKGEVARPGVPGWTYGAATVAGLTLVTRSPAPPGSNATASEPPLEPNRRLSARAATHPRAETSARAAETRGTCPGNESLRATPGP